MLRCIFCAVLVAATAATAGAQPAKPDLAEAARLYHSAEQAMTERRYDDAARDYGAAYEISKDAVLFFKIGSALDKAGKCPVAVNYYRRYLREGKPSPEHQKLTSERIATCEGQRKPDDAKAPPKADDKAPPKEDKPKAVDDKAPKADGKTPGPDDKAKPTSQSAAAGAAGTPSSTGPGGATADATAEPQLAADGPLAGAVAAAGGDGSAGAEPMPELANPPAGEAGSYPPPPLRRTAAWLSVGTGIAFVTIGAVLALSAESTEDDLADLYITRPGGAPLSYDGRTQKRYDQLVDRGDRYETLAWASFGLAGAAAAAATYFFLTSPSSDERAPAQAMALRPMIARQGAGVGASWRF